MAEMIPLKKDGKINPEVFSIHAENIANKIHEEGGRSTNNLSQLRRFYDEFFKLYQRAEGFSSDNFEKIILPQLHMLIPKVVYAKGRKLVTDTFVNMIKELVNKSGTKQDLKIATQFFEAFIGFYRIYSK